MSRFQSRTRLALESLEHRWLLAGDVQVQILDGNLIVQGDSESNHIAIVAGDQPGVVFVAGKTIPGGDTTTVNGLQGRVRFQGLQRNVLIDMGDGSDQVLAPNLSVPEGLAVRMGTGEDQLIFGDPPRINPTPIPPGVVRVGGEVAVGMGDQSDLIVVHGLHVRGRARFDLGAGNDRMLAGPPPSPGDGMGDPDRAAFRGMSDLAIELGDGDDRLGLNGVTADGHVFVGGSEGADHLALDHARAGAGFRVLAGPGDDHLSLNHIRSPHLGVSTGDGNDRVAIRNATLRGLTVNLGDGDDGLAIGQTRVDGPVLLAGGDGEDTLVNLGDNRFRRVSVEGFEHRVGPGGPTAAAGDDQQDLEAHLWVASGLQA